MGCNQTTSSADDYHSTTIVEEQTDDAIISTVNKQHKQKEQEYPTYMDGSFIKKAAKIVMGASNYPWLKPCDNENLAEEAVYRVLRYEGRNIPYPGEFINRSKSKYRQLVFRYYQKEISRNQYLQAKVLDQQNASLGNANQTLILPVFWEIVDKIDDPMIRQVAYLRLKRGLTFEEIAEVLSTNQSQAISLNQVYKTYRKLSKIYHELRDYLDSQLK